MQISKLAIREIKNSKNFSLVFIINLSLGLLGFVCLNSFNDSLNISLEGRAKTLLAADMTIGGRRDLTPEESKAANEVMSDKYIYSHKLISIYSMGAVKKPDGQKSRLMNIKAIGKNYPLYGEITLSESGKISSQKTKDLETAPVAWVSKELQHQLKLKLGDKIKLGTLDFTISNIINSDTTTSWRGIGLAPKIYVGRDYLLKTGLVSFGSVAGYSNQFLLKQEFQNKNAVEELKKQLLEKITDPAVKVYLPENSSEQVGRILNYLTDYLGLVALVALFLSGIGTAYLFQSFLFIRLKEIGILKSLGLSKSKIMGIYATQVTLLGLAAVALSSIAAAGLLPLLNKIVNEEVGFSLKLHYSVDAFLVSFLVAILAGLLVCLPILYKMLEKKTSDILFGQEGFKWQWGTRDVLTFIPLLLLFWGLSIWQSHSILIGSTFVISILISICVFLWILPRILKLMDNKLKSMHVLRRPGGLSWGLGLRYLVRNPFATTMSFLALSLGIMLLSLIGQLEKSLQTELMDRSVPKPSLFLFDIQEEQHAELVKFADDENIPMVSPSPMVRGRITQINGEKFERLKNERGSFQTREDETQTRFRNRGINLSYALKPNESETIVEGKEFPGVFQEEKQETPYISLEKRYAKRLGVKLGDVLTFDILGVEVKGKVLNLRKVKWTSFVPNFFIVFQPGVIEEAPKTYLTAIKQVQELEQYRIQDLLVEKFHNISILNVTELIGKILTTFGMMGIAIKMMALLCLLVGMVVIFAITQHQVQKEAVELTIQKVLGLRWKQQLIIINKSFAVTVILATVLGTLFSILLGNLLSIMFFDGVWTLDGGYLVTIFGGIIILTLVTVSMACIQILRRKSRAFLS
jgi:putative ABC transport system permease protein